MYIHLDTNFISQFAKIELGIARVQNSASLQLLLHKLRDGVRSGRIMCPVSEFLLEELHELEPANELVSQCETIVSELSQGYFLRYWEEVMVHETAVQLLKYLNRPLDIDLNWSPFTKITPITSHPPSAGHFKKDFMRGGDLLRAEKAPKRSLIEQYQAEKIAFLQESFLHPIRKSKGLPTLSDNFNPNLRALKFKAHI